MSRSFKRGYPWPPMSAKARIIEKPISRAERKSLSYIFCKWTEAHKPLVRAFAAFSAEHGLEDL